MTNEMVKIVKMKEEGMSYRDIAKVTGRSLGTIKAKISRIRNGRVVQCVECVECGKLYPAGDGSLFCCSECREKWLKKQTTL